MSDLISGGGPDTRRPLPPGLVRVGTALAAVALGVGIWSVRSPAPATPPRPAPAAGDALATDNPSPAGPRFSCAAKTPPTTPQAAAGVVAIAIDGARGGGALDRHDPAAATRAWAVVLRRPDGSLGRHGAVVTFPVDAVEIGHAVAVGPGAGRVGSGALTWSIGGSSARVRGDVGDDALLAIARRTTVTGRRPTVRPPAGYTVISSGPYRPTHIREIRYDGVRTGGTPSIGGLVYTGVLTGGGFEDMLYAGPAVDCGTVHGRPAVLSPVLGGNGTLAWEPAPGVVAYVGYSGSDFTGRVLGGIHGLAERTRTMNALTWQALFPDVSGQVNDLQ